MKTFNRGTLRKLAAAGRLEMVSSYHFDDMHGESHGGERLPKPVAYPWPTDWHDRKDGTVYLKDSDFTSGSGRAWVEDNGLITLYVHSNSNFTFRVKA